ncbi:hypothetical protein POM88_049077 [Heracleum sosnowskyi]|uniref:Uncharacterized protein n=1 Tax=Heracleum sosnowskyi TaxID=360622 RepID=A0AAD8GWB4_9APIA|nr:hypothetical protein POM88_049077 [Heracleum sosnowskyi]
MASSSNQAQNFDYTIDIESSSGNILNNQNNVFIAGVCDSTATSVIEEFVDVFDDSFGRTTNLWKPKVSDPNLKPYSGQRRWLRNAEERFCTLKFPDDLQSSNAHIVKDTSKKILTEFQNCYGKVSNHIEGLNFMLEEMKCLNIRIEEKFHKSAVTKHDMLEENFGVRPSGASSVLPPLQSNNKGSRKRILGPARISCDGKKRKMKNCRNFSVT